MQKCERIMTETMIERVARAINSEWQKNGVVLWSSSEPNVGACSNLARVAIEAMREPTEAMVQSLSARDLPFGLSTEIVQQESVAVWQAMIDKVLQDGEAQDRS